jgi:hypothetical protein
MAGPFTESGIWGFRQRVNLCSPVDPSRPPKCHKMRLHTISGGLKTLCLFVPGKEAAQAGWTHWCRPITPELGPPGHSFDFDGPQPTQMELTGDNLDSPPFLGYHWVIWPGWGKIPPRGELKLVKMAA